MTIPAGPITLLSAALVASLLTAPAFAQNPGYEPPRTLWGHPDLQGDWTNETITPLERPEGRARALSEAEAARIEAERAAVFQASLAPSDPDRPAPPVGGNQVANDALNSGPGTYNSVYVDHGDRVAFVNGEYRTSLVTFPANGRVPPITARGRAELEAYREARSQFGAYDNPENRSLAERCVLSFGSNAGPPILPNGFYNNNYAIAQTENEIVIHTEMVHDTRIIRLGEPRRLPDHIRPWFGDSWGRWEADTLVVETTNIHPDQRFRGLSSDNLTVVERFHRMDDETILYRFEIQDPTTYTERWGGEVPMVRMAPGEYLYEYACHEGNYALYNILRGARAQEANGDEAEPDTNDQQ